MDNIHNRDIYVTLFYSLGRQPILFKQMHAWEIFLNNKRFALFDIDHGVL
jgi:hypothetical protein